MMKLRREKSLEESSLKGLEEYSLKSLEESSLDTARHQGLCRSTPLDTKGCVARHRSTPRVVSIDTFVNFRLRIASTA